MFYLMMHSTHFIYGYFPSDICLRTTQIKRGNLLLPYYRLLFPFSKGSFIFTILQNEMVHTTVFVIPVVEQAGMRNNSIYPPFGFDLMTHHTMFRLSTTELRFTRHGCSKYKEYFLCTILVTKMFCLYY